MVARCVEFYYKRQRLTGYFRMTRLCYSQRSEDVYKTLMIQRLTFCHRIEPHHKIHDDVLENYSQIRSKLSVVIREEVVLNRLKDLLACNICAQDFSVPEIIMEGFKIEQKVEQSKIHDNILIINRATKQTGYQKTARYSYSSISLKNQLFSWLHLARKHYTAS